MNYLAHIFLSGSDTQLRIGNFIADSVRGKYFTQFPKGVAAGIILHRLIDQYTDTHVIVKKSKDLIRPHFGIWSSVIIDLYYDHLLAAQWDQYHTQDLASFSLDFYQDLEAHKDILPPKVIGFMPIMQQYNWLLMYASKEGITSIYAQMNRRTKGKSKMDTAMGVLALHEETLKEHFALFFADLIQFTIQKSKTDLLGDFYQ